MRDEAEHDPKKPRPISIRRKRENTPEAQEHGPSEVGPDSREHGERYHHMHVRC